MPPAPRLATRRRRLCCALLRPLTEEEELASDQALRERLPGNPTKMIPYMNELEYATTDEEDEDREEFENECERLVIS